MSIEALRPPCMHDRSPHRPPPCFRFDHATGVMDSTCVVVRCWLSPCKLNPAARVQALVPHTLITHPCICMHAHKRMRGLWALMIRPPAPSHTHTHTHTCAGSSAPICRGNAVAVAENSSYILCRTTDRASSCSCQHTPLTGLRPAASSPLQGKERCG